NSGDEKNGNNIVNIMKFKNKNIEEKFIIEMTGRLNAQGKSTAILVRTQKEENRFKAAAGINENRHSYIGTIHKSKGLEFDVIFIANVSRGNIPHLKSIPPAISQRKNLRHSFIQFLDDGIKLETDRDDEIKLFYVAVSRAKEKVFITYSGEISEFLID
ncbi:MAG: 3'-5' exonuclease, partial [bacterium]